MKFLEEIRVLEQEDIQLCQQNYQYNTIEEHLGILRKEK